MLHLFGRRALWRTGFGDISLSSLSRTSTAPTSRFTSTWMQDVDEIARQTNTPRLSGRVHILGVGNVGKFVAHSLISRQSPPPITLMIHTPRFYERFRDKKYCVALNTNGLDDLKTGFDANVFRMEDWSWRSIPYSEQQANDKRDIQEIIADAEEDNSPIECLILSVKAHTTVSALKRVSHRLTSDSTICFLQNGMGTIEQVNKELFRDPAQRPHYVMGIISHGLTRKDAYQVAYVGVGTTILSPVSSSDTFVTEGDIEWPPTTKYLLRLLTLTPQLVAVAEPPSSLLQYQLEKLAVNCVINPLTVLFECKNGELLYSYSVTRVMRLLLFEISNVICALPELQGVPGVEDRFAPERLRRMIVNVMNKTSNNVSSMRQDYDYRKSTEIDYLNGYIVRRGEELGIKCPLNYMVKHMVLGKSGVKIRREQAAIPMDFQNIDLGDAVTKK